MSDEKKLTDRDLYEMYLMELLLIDFDDATDVERLSFEDFMVLKGKGLFDV